jgi:hypothetical protein
VQIVEIILGNLKAKGANRALCNTLVDCHCIAPHEGFHDSHGIAPCGQFLS